MPNECWIYFDGDFHRNNEKLFTSANRAIKFGDGLFDTIYFSKNSIFYESRHFQRILTGMEILGLDVDPVRFIGELKILIPRLVNLNKIEGSARVRIEIFRSGEGNFSPESTEFKFFIEAIPLENNMRFKKEPVALCFYDGINIQLSPLSTFKTCSSLPYILAALYAKNNSCDDAILLSGNSVAETSSSNIFVVKKNTLFTPSLETGCLPGIMRGEIISFAKNSNVEVKEIRFEKAFLLDADAVFISNVIHGIRKVNRVGKIQLPGEFNELVSSLCKGIEN